MHVSCRDGWLDGWMYALAHISTYVHVDQAFTVLFWIFLIRRFLKSKRHTALQPVAQRAQHPLIKEYNNIP